MNVLILGAQGQLGRALRRTQPSDVRVQLCGHGDADVCDVTALSALVSSAQPDTIVNAVAYTAVDAAEDDQAQAFAVNAQGARNVARCARAVGARVVYVSTNYVFDGLSAAPYDPAAKTNPLNVYGQSKLAGEKRTLEELPDAALILRTAGLFSTNGPCFVTTMLRLMQERPSLQVVHDQLGSPTWSTSLARAVWSAVQQGLCGIHHWTDAGVVSWFDFALEIRDRALALGLLQQETPIEPVASAHFPAAATRPLNGVLDVTATQDQLRVAPEHWRIGLDRVLHERARG